MMVDQYPDDRTVLAALRSLAASGERVDSGQLRQACGLSAARIRESVQRLRWQGRVAMASLELSDSERRWVRAPAAEATPVSLAVFAGRHGRTGLRMALGFGLAALEAQLRVAFDDDRATIERKIAAVCAALAELSEPQAAVIVASPPPEPAPPTVPTTTIAVRPTPPPTPRPSSPPVADRHERRPFVSWAETRQERIRQARRYLDGHGYAVTRHSLERGTWKLAGRSETFDDDDLVDFADAARRREQA